MDHLILLDLLGNSHSRILSYYRETDWLHDEMANADQRLRELGLVDVESGEEGWFGMTRMGKGAIGDDHVPVCHPVWVVNEWWADSDDWGSF